MLVTAGTADGAVPTEIVDGWGAEDSLSLRPHVSLDWEWRRRRGAIRRETLCYAHETLGGASLCPEGSRVLLADDLETERTTSVLTVTPALALGDAFELSFALPIVLSEQTDLRHASGVDEGNSLTDPYNRPSLFEVPARGPTRAGLADVSATLRVAPFGFGEERDGRWVLIDYGEIVVHGHTITWEPEFRHNRIGIDTGAFTSGVLSALVLEGHEQEVVCVDDA